MMHEQRRLRQQARIRDMVLELADDHQLTAKFINELVKVAGDLGEQRQFSVRVAACLEKDALEFVEVLGEGAKMVDHRIRR